MGASPRLLALVLVVTLAGCGSLSGGTTPTVSVTPVDAPRPSTGVPGITADEVDPDAVASTHDATLARTNYTVRVTEVVTRDGRLLRNATRDREIARENRAYGIVRRVNATDIPTSAAAPYEAYWYNQSVTLLRFGTGPRTQFQAYDSGTSGPLSDPSGHETVRTVLAAFEFRVTNVSASRTAPSNRTAYVLRSERVVDAGAIPTSSYIGTPANATATVWVRDDGVVRAMELAYDATASGIDDRARVALHFRYRNVGNTTVHPPTWAARALAGAR